MFVLPFSNIRKEDIAGTGGKGANLGELVAAGLPVPDGFVIDTVAYSHFVAANAIQAPLLALAAQVRADDPASVEKISLQIQALFHVGALPDDLAAAIRAAYEALPAQGESADSAVAVRSSATAEDLPGASFAGQQDTYLNVRGADAVLDAVKKCWASLWTARALAYRARQGIDPATVSLAVVVQQMVNADAAGILFTANPQNGRRNEATIDAAWGLGEAVVGGLVTPDQWVINKSDGRVLAQTIADKATMTVRTPQGVAQQPVPPERRRLPALENDTAAQLVHLAVRIEQHYAMPMDIEWAVAGGKLYILQARPITALPAPSAEPPTVWPIPFDGYFMRGSITEQLPDPLSPLFGTLATPEMTKTILALFSELMPVDMSDTFGFVTINGYAYLFMLITPNFWKMWPATARAVGPVLRGEMMMWWRDKFRPRYVAAIEKWSATPPQQMTAADLLAGARELTHRGTELYTGVQAVIPIAMTSELSFTAYYNSLIRRAGDAPAQTLLLGFDSQPLRAEKALYDIAEWSRQQPALAALLTQAPASEAGALIAHAQPPTGVDAAIWQEWQSRFRTYLGEFGHATYNLDFMYPVAADYPDPLYETFKYYVQGKGKDPYARQAEAVAARVRATQTQLNRLDPARANLFRRLLHWAQSAGPVREDALADIGLGWPLLRTLLLELGDRLARAGAIAARDDIFWLEDAEVTQAAAALDGGQRELDSLAARVEERKMIWRGQKRALAPQILPENSRLNNRWIATMMPAATEKQSGPVIKGAAVGAGSVTATARVLHDPSDFTQMQPGDVLVAAITTPAWTPLFALASAVVTDIGGPMSHGSIVAREYGIPAVLGTGVATKRIVSGQQIRVDGDAGTVTLLDEVGERGATAQAPARSRARKWAPLVLAAGALLGAMMWLRRKR